MHRHGLIVACVPSAFNVRSPQRNCPALRAKVASDYLERAVRLEEKQRNTAV